MSGGAYVRYEADKVRSPGVSVAESCAGGDGVIDAFLSVRRAGLDTSMACSADGRL